MEGDETPEIVIAASGGGHTGHAVAIAQQLRRLGAEPGFIVVEGDRWSLLRLKGLGRVVASVPSLLRAGETAAALPRRLPLLARALLGVPRGVRVLVSTGSSHSVAAALAARLKGGIVVHVEVSERLAGPSGASRFLGPVASLYAAQWPEQMGFLPRGRSLLVGPVYEEPRYPARDLGYVLVTAGTQGFPELFDTVRRLGLPRVVLQTGRVDPGPYRRPGWRVFRFDPDLHRWIAGASLVVSHFGRTVIDAALTYGKPVLIVPNPRWSTARGAGFRDAVLLARRLNVAVAPPKAARDPELLARALRAAERLRPRRYPNGGAALARVLIWLARGGEEGDSAP